MRSIIKSFQNHLWIFPLGALLTLVIGQACGGGCSALSGDILGVDLNIVGGLYYAFLLAIAVVMRKKSLSLLASLAALGMGAEVIFVGYQFQHDTYCIKCLVSGAFLLAMFLFTVTSVRKWLAAALLAAGAFSTLFLFNGSVTPIYAAQDDIPRFGKTSNSEYEIIVYSDYFCPACREVDGKIAGYLRQMKGKASVSFVDVPIHKESPAYARVFLYVCFAAKGNLDTILKARDILFLASKDKAEESALLSLLTKQGIAYKADADRAQSIMKNAYNTLIKKDGIKGTPTLVIEHKGDRKSHTGSRQILTAIGEKSW